MKFRALTACLADQYFSKQVIAVGPGTLGDDGSRTPLTIAAGSSVLYSKYAGSEFKGAEGDYIVLKVSDVIAVLSS